MAAVFDDLRQFAVAMTEKLVTVADATWTCRPATPTTNIYISAGRNRRTASRAGSLEDRRRRLRIAPSKAASRRRRPGPWPRLRLNNSSGSGPRPHRTIPMPLQLVELARRPTSIMQPERVPSVSRADSTPGFGDVLYCRPSRTIHKSSSNFGCRFCEDFYCSRLETSSNRTDYADVS